MEREKDVQEVVEKSKQQSAPLRLRLSLLSTGWTNVLRVGTVVSVADDFGYGCLDKGKRVSERR